MSAIANIRDALRAAADHATSNGEEYEFDGWADAHGNLTDQPQLEDGYRVLCWWDTADPHNPGYALRVIRWEDGENIGEESDEL